MSSGSFVTRGVNYVQRRGVRSAAGLLADHAKRRVWAEESHTWYALDLEGERPRRPLPEDLRLVRDDREALDRIADLDTISPAAARERLDAGGRSWLVLDDQGRGAFACWNFFGAAPVFAAAGGELQLPGHVVVLEDSVTSPEQRGRGVAPAVWSVVGDTLASEGFRYLITKIERANVPSRKAIVKAGFRLYALDEHVQRGPRRQVRVWTDGGELGEHLVSALPAARAPGPSPEPFDA